MPEVALAPEHAGFDTGNLSSPGRPGALPRSPSREDPLVPDETRAPRSQPSFRSTLIRVLAVQVVSLLLLWALQARYGG